MKEQNWNSKKKTRLGRWLEERCKREHLSLRGAAARTGLCHTTIKDIIKGVHPYPETIRKLAGGFGGGALLDHLMFLAGYKTERPGEPSAAMVELIDKEAGFDDRQVQLMTHFADFLREEIP